MTWEAGSVRVWVTWETRGGVREGVGDLGNWRHVKEEEMGVWIRQTLGHYAADIQHKLRSETKGEGGGDNNNIFK